MNPATVISVLNQKGGVGKTTSCAALAEELQARGFSVLSVDLDPQGDLSYIMRADVEEAPTMRDVMREEIPAAEAIQHTAAGDVLPADVDLAGVEMEIISKWGREHILKRALAEVSQKYDFIIIDGPRGLGIMTVNALAASDRVLIPMAAASLSVKGLRQLVKITNEVREMLNPGLKYDGILITRFDGRANVRKDLRGMIEGFADQLGCRVYGPIREAAAVEEAQSSQTPLQEYAAGSKFAADYKEFVDAFLA